MQVLLGNGRAQSDLLAEIHVAESAASVLLLNRKVSSFTAELVHGMHALVYHNKQF